MKFKIYIEDLPDAWISRIREVLRHDLAEQIEEAVTRGIEPETAEAEVIDDYLNRYNVGWELEL